MLKHKFNRAKVVTYSIMMTVLLIYFLIMEVIATAVTIGYKSELQLGFEFFRCLLVAYIPIVLWRYIKELDRINMEKALIKDKVRQVILYD